MEVQRKTSNFIKSRNIYLHHPVFSASQIVISGTNVDHPYGLVHVGGPDDLVLYWTEFTDGHVKWYNKTGSNNSQPVPVLQRDSVPVFEIRLYDAKMQQDLGKGDGQGTWII